MPVLGELGLGGGEERGAQVAVVVGAGRAAAGSVRVMGWF